MSSTNPISLARKLQLPASLKEFRTRFPKESDCEEFLFGVRFPDGFICPTCGIQRGWSLKGRRLTECANGHKVSLTSGTILHGTRQDLLTWFHAAYLVSTFTPGISALQFQRQLGLTRYETAFQMLHKIRSSLVTPGRELLRCEVEVDETFIGGKDPDRGGRGGDKVIVVGAVEVSNSLTRAKPQARQPVGRVRLRVVADASADSLAGFVESEVETDAIVHTDGWDGYRRLNHSGYRHRRVVQGKGRTAKPVLPHIHRVFSNLKLWLKGTHHGRIESYYLQAYLNEYEFRFNRRFWRGPAFLRALMLMIATPPQNHKM
ncbi:MAG: IS1595 family transposase [Proteobacteria bacterium]|nr:IS1595 family transposase [Pseudomonadota bacterium]